MPIVIDTGSVAQTGTDPSSLVRQFQVAPRATWTGPAGEVYQLADFEAQGLITTARPTGLGAIGRTFTTDPMPSGGEMVRFVSEGARTIGWPLYLGDDDEPTFRSLRRALVRSFLSSAKATTPGMLTIYFPDGEARSITCHYVDGLQGNESSQYDGITSDNVVVQLLCPDGAWTDATPINVRFTYDPGGDFLSPFPTISPAVVGDVIPIFNGGDKTAWPTFTITGPASSLYAGNLTTRRSWTFGGTIDPDNPLTIVTRPPFASVLDNTGNRIGEMNWPGAKLWGLAPGLNELQITLAGAQRTSVVQMSYQRRYETF